MTGPTGLTDRDPRDVHLSLSATGLLRLFNQAGVIDAVDVHVATRLGALAGADEDETIALAVALAVRAVRAGSVCVDLRTVADSAGTPEHAELPWPQPAAWLAALRSSPLLGNPPVLHVEDDGLLYLDRYWREEQQVCADLRARLTPLPPEAPQALTAGLDRVFHRPGSQDQRAAAAVALSQRTTVLTGGPGTGKTTTVAGLLALLTEQAELAGRPALRIALAAPTGKASARLQEAVRLEIGNLDEQDRSRLLGLQAVTLHRLLGPLPRTASRFRHHRGNRLPHDVIVVDETSMVSLTIMARLLEAARPDSRLILVGDPDQLSSVDAGAVLADLVDGLGEQGCVAELKISHRFGETIGALADAIRLGDADRVLEVLRSGSANVEFIETGEPTAVLRELLVPRAIRLRDAALSDPAAAAAVLEEHRLLCAHRAGPYGVRQWNRQVERWLAEETGDPIWTDWYVGRPILVTANDYGLGLYNGDTGVTVLHDGVLRAVISGADGAVDFAVSRLADVETMHAMTIHKSQGSQADEVTVLLPSADSRLLSRELFYTAVTRARKTVRVVGSEAEVRAALGRRVVRASGLSRQLRR